MNKKFQGKFRICLGAVLLLPLFAQAASTVTLPLVLPTATSGSSTGKLSGTVSSLSATTSNITALPLLPAAAPMSAASSASGGSGSGGIPLPGLEGLGSGSGLPIGKLPGIRPIRLPGPIPN